MSMDKNPNTKPEHGTPEEEAKADTSAEQNDMPVEEIEINLPEKDDSGEESSKEEMSEEEPEKKVPFFKTQKWKHGGIATAFTAGFIVLVILVNVVVSILSDRFPSMNLDLSADSSYTLSETALEVVDAVTQPTKITICANPDSAGSLLDSYYLDYGQVMTLASKMAERNSNITVEYVDLDTNPTFASNYSEALSTGSVIVETDQRHRVLSINDLFSTSTNQQTYQTTYYSRVDGALASAVNQANATTLPVAAFVTGHNEMMDSSALKSLLSSNNFETVDFNLLTDEIPEDTQLLVITTPSTDFTEEELEKLDNYLNDTSRAATRSMMVTFYPSQDEMPVLASFMEEWGVRVSKDVVVETDANHVVSSNPTAIMVDTSGSSINFGGDSSTYNYLTMPQSSPIELLYSTQSGITTYELASSYDTTYLVNADNANEADTENTDSYLVAALSQKPISIDGENYTANVFTLTSSLMIDGTYLNSSAFANSSYLVDMVKYATDTTNSDMGVTIKSVEVNALDLTMSASVATIIGLVIFTIIIPLAILIAGIVVFLKRRHL